MFDFYLSKWLPFDRIRNKNVKLLKANNSFAFLINILDWEFPSAHNREKQKFSQLLHEIRREYQREHRTYLLSVAVAAPEGIVFYAYDIGEINKYADFVNIMTYDYHFYSTSSPFTGKRFIDIRAYVLLLQIWGLVCLFQYIYTFVNNIVIALHIFVVVG